MATRVDARAQSWPLVSVVAFSLFIDYFLYGVLLPLSANSPAGLRSEEQMAWLYGAYAASVLFVTPLFGYLGDRVGGRSILLFGVVLAGSATALFGFGSNFQILLLARLCLGAGSAALWTAGLSLIAAHYVEKRVEMIGYAFTGSTAGSVLGPVAGGMLSQVGGYALPFVITGVLLVVDAILIMLAISPVRARQKEKLNGRTLLLNKSLVAPAVAITLAAFAVGIIEPLLPVRLARDGISPKITGVIFTISTLVYGLSAPVVGRVSSRLSVNKVMTLVRLRWRLPFLYWPHSGKLRLFVSQFPWSTSLSHLC